MSRLFPWMGERPKSSASETDKPRNAPDRAQVMMQEAAQALERNDTATARTLYEQCVVIFNSRNQKREEADAQHALAQLLVGVSDFVPAFVAYSRSVELYRKLNTRGQLAVTLRDAGFASTDSGDPDKATEFLTESLKIFEAASDKAGAASALEGLGLVSLEQRDFESAREYFQRSLGLHRSLDLNPESAVSLVYLAMVALACDEMDSSEALYRESIDRFRDHNAESSLVPPLLTLGDVAFSTQDAIQVAELLQAALAVFGASRLKRSWDSAMTKLGGVAQRRNVNQSRLEVYRHSLSVDPAKDEWGAEAIACLGLGCVAYRQDRPKIGKVLIARSLNLCRQNGDLDTVLYVLAYASAYTYRCQHYPDSQQYHVQCADAAKNVGDVLQMADAMCYAAFIASWLGQYEEARKCCVEAAAVYRQQGLLGDTARTMSLMGTLFCFQNDAETGIKIHDQAVAQCVEIGEPVGIALALSSKGASLIRIDLDQARACLQESVDLLYNQHEAIEEEVLFNVAELERLSGNYTAAYDIFCDSLARRSADQDRFGCAGCLTGCGLIAAAVNVAEANALLLLARSESIRTTLGVPLLSPLKEEVEAATESLKTLIGADGVSQAVKRGETITLRSAAELAESMRDSIPCLSTS